LAAASAVALNEQRRFLFLYSLQLNAQIWQWYTFCMPWNSSLG